MKSLQTVFVAICTALTVLAIFLIINIVLVGILALVFYMFSEELGRNVFRWGVSSLFVVELIFTLPAIAKTLLKDEGEK